MDYAKQRAEYCAAVAEAFKWQEAILGPAEGRGASPTDAAATPPGSPLASAGGATRLVMSPTHGVSSPAWRNMTRAIDPPWIECFQHSTGYGLKWQLWQCLGIEGLGRHTHPRKQWVFKAGLWLQDLDHMCLQVSRRNSQLRSRGQTSPAAAAARPERPPPPPPAAAR